MGVMNFGTQLAQLLLETANCSLALNVVWSTQVPKQAAALFRGLFTLQETGSDIYIQNLLLSSRPTNKLNSKEHAWLAMFGNVLALVGAASAAFGW